jgi:DNA-binding NtrC family response regulator
MTSRDRVPRAPSGSSHDNGQSTGLRRSNGFFELAHGETLFLGEIGDASLPPQAKRALQDQEMIPASYRKQGSRKLFGSSHA